MTDETGTRDSSDTGTIATVISGGSRDDIAFDRGETVGRYLILECLGAGGMGAVFKAYDPDLDRKIAIKLMKSSGWNEEGRIRVLREAQAMARLTHPNVVRIYDVGRFEDELFIAMELVEGVTLRQWIKEAPRSWRQVVSVMTQVGRGLAAAHEAGLVHRDVKPANVLLAEDGGVRVMDFGVARPMQRDGAQASSTAGDEELAGLPAALTSRDSLSDSTSTGSAGPVLSVELTRAGSVIGTPAYMAPEQTLGVTDARTDQYSFCVTLHECLHGKRPPYVADDRRIPKWLRELVRRGLSTDPDRRYPSMMALLQELDRDWAGRRRRLSVLAAVVVFAGGATAISLAAGEESRPCRGAERRLAGAWDDQVRRAVEQSFAASGRTHGAETAHRVIAALDEHTSAWVAAREAACEATRVVGDQSEHVMDLRMRCLDRRLGEVRALTELFAAADGSIVDKAVEAVGGLTPLTACADIEALTAAVPAPEDPEVRAEVDAVRAQLDRAWARQQAGKTVEGLPIAEAAAERARTLEYKPLLAQALFRLGTLQSQGDRVLESEATLREAVQVAARARDDDLIADVWLQLQWVLGDLRAQHDTALALTETVQAAIGRAGDDPIRDGTLQQQLGVIAYASGKFDLAREHLEAAMKVWDRALAPDDPRVASTLNHLGITFNLQGKFDEGVACFERALAIREKSLGPEHPSVGGTLNNLGLTFARIGQDQRARDHYVRALAIFEHTLGPEHPHVASCLDNLGTVLERIGSPAEALAQHERSLAIKRKVYGSDHPRVGTSLDNAGLALVKLGRVEEALANHRRSIDIKTGALGADHPDLTYPLMYLGRLELERGNLAEARANFQRALDIARKSLEPQHPLAGQALQGLGECDLIGRQYAAAVAHLREALAIRTTQPVTPSERGATEFALARALWPRPLERAEAKRLAGEALLHFRAEGEYSRAERVEVERWLQAHR